MLFSFLSNFDIKVNGEYTEVFRKFVLENSIEDCISGNDRLNQLYDPYIWRVPTGTVTTDGSFYESTRINFIANIPLFTPVTTAQYTLEMNLKDSVIRLLESSLKLLEPSMINDTKNRGVSTIAFPAIGGTYGRLDSEKFITYNQSYFTLLESLQEAREISQLSGVYLVLYDELPPKEYEVAYTALRDVFLYLQ